ncbi:hypothetical protein LguiA_020595 [Lonicera macranthoides]
MKRRNRINLKDQPMIRDFSSRGITGVRRSDNRFDKTASIENEDVNRLKRVKFQDPGTDKLPNCRSDASSIQNDAPKTSEYAFFKKLKKNACGHSYPPEKRENQLKDVELSECTKEIFDTAKKSYKDLRPSLPVKKARPINHESFLSPPARVSKNSAITNMVDPSSKGIRSQLLAKKCHLDPNSRQVHIDTKHQLPSCYASDTRVKGFNWTCTKNLMESEHGSYWDDGFPRYRSDRPGDIFIPELDNVGSDYPPISYTTKTHLWYKYHEPLCDSSSGRISSSCTESDLFLGLPYPNNELAHFKELDEFDEPNRPALRGEPHTLLLGWDFNKKEERDPSIMSHNTEMNLFSALTTSWSNYPQNMRDRLNALTPRSSSLFSNNSLYSLLDSHSSSFCTHHFGRYLQDEKYQISELDQLPSISRNPKYLKLVEDCISDSTPEDSSLLLSPQDHTWYLNRDYKDMHHSGFESLNFGLGMKCLSMVDSFAEHHSSSYNMFQCLHNEGVCPYLLENDKKSCLYNSDHANEVSEGMLNHHGWPVTIFQISSDKEMGHPLLLDNSSRARSKDEKYCYDDDEWKYI